MEPLDCEDAYLTAIRDCDWIGDTDLGLGERPRTSCYAGYSAVYERVQSSRWLRLAASWFGFKIGPAWGPIGVDINQNWVTDALLDDFNNRLLIYARKMDACNKWYMLWDAKDCSAAYGGFG